MNKYEAYKAMKDRNYFGCMLVETGEADCMISGLSRNYPDTIKPALQVIGTEDGVKKNCGNVHYVHQTWAVVLSRYNH
ncbi:MAG: phosphate acyltransferase [Ferruginibacter sp.]